MTKPIKAGSVHKGKVTPAKSQLFIADKSSSVEVFIKKNPLFLFTTAAFLVLCIVFYRFLIFKDTYLFKDIGSDTINDFWPNLVHLSDYFRTSGLPKWSFNDGTGKNLYPFTMGNPFNIVLGLFTKDSIPYAIIFIEVIKIYLGGLFFFLFLRTLRLTAFTCIVGGLLYSFSGFMIIGSSLYIFSTEALYASMVLYSVEKFLSKGNWYLLPVPFFLFAAFQPFLLYFYGILAAVYAIVRTITNEYWQWKQLMLTIVKITGLAIFGVMMSSFIFFSNIDLLIHIPRSFGGDASAFKQMISVPIFSLCSFTEITTSLYRFFSNDLMGTGNNFRGWQNYLEDPTFYTGLLTCLLMPQAFFLMKRRKKIIYLFLLILSVIPLVFPFFRHALWLFSGDYYRTYSLFLSMVFLVFCLKTLSALDSKAKINSPVLFITIVILLFLLFYPFYSESTSPVNNKLRPVIAFLLVLYTCIIYLFNISKIRSQKILSLPLVLGIPVLLELTYFSSISVNQRIPVSSSDLQKKVGFNDYTMEALKYINARDSGFFRINKDYGSTFAQFDRGYNDGLIQNYKGTASYNSFCQPYYCNFLNELNVWSVEGLNFRRLMPFQTRPLLTSLMNEKYVLTKHRFRKIPILYDSLTTIGNVSITRNKLSLPFGYTYQNYISLSEFRKLGKSQKDKMLFQAFIADSSELPGLENLKQLYAKDTIAETSINLDEFIKLAAILRKDSLSNVFYNQNTIQGTIKLNKPKLLFLSIPYDKGWQVAVDGAIIRPLITNIGFIGLVLLPGVHSIKLNYEPPFLKIGCYISGFSLLAYAFLLINYKKRRF